MNSGAPSAGCPVVVVMRGHSPASRAFRQDRCAAHNDGSTVPRRASLGFSASLPKVDDGLDDGFGGLVRQEMPGDGDDTALVAVGEVLRVTNQA